MTLEEMMDAARRGSLPAGRMNELNAMLRDQKVAQQIYVAAGSLAGMQGLQQSALNNAMQGQLSQEIFANSLGQVVPKTESEQAKWLRGLLEEAEREALESAQFILAQANKISALEAEIATLRARSAERDASVAWAIKRGTKP